MDSSTPPLTEGQKVIGSMLVAAVPGWMLALFGCGYVTCVGLTYFRSKHFAQDPIRLKLAAVAIALLIIIGIGINAAELFHYATFQGRASAKAVNIRLSEYIVLVQQGLVAALVQYSLARRAASLMGATKLKWAFAGTAYLLISNALVWAIVSAAAFRLCLGKLTYIAIVTSNCSSVVVDVMIVSVLVADFRDKLQGLGTNQERTKGVLHELIKLSLWTSGMTCLVALLAAVGCLLPLTSLETLDLQALFAPSLPPLYALSFFRQFSARDELRRRLRGPFESTFQYFRQIFSSHREDPGASRNDIELRRSEDGEAGKGRPELSVEASHSHP